LCRVMSELCSTIIRIITFILPFLRSNLFIVATFVCFFFLISLRSLRFTLFPYTTLFRSDLVASSEEGESARAGFDAFLQRLGNRDRKSTRLNSSHVEISYAVFCLKKKKI